MMAFLYSKKDTLKNVFLLLSGLYIFLFFFNPIETEDVWWHLSTGRWILEHGQLPQIDIFPFMNEKVPWSCHNEWLGSVILYSVVKFFGLFGLKVARCLFFFLIIGILFRHAKKHLPFVILTLFSLLVILGVSSRSFLKPDMFNIFFIQLFLINLFNYENSGQRKSLWGLPVLMCVWFNIHLGSLVYGIPLVGIFFTSACIQYAYGRFGKKSDLLEQANALKKIKDLALTIALCLASFIINPYGIEGVLYPFKIFLIPSFIGFYKFAASIHEMQPPWYIFKSFNYFYYFLIFAMSAAVLFFNKKNNLTLILLLAFSTFAFLYVGRNAAFFTIVAAYVFVMGAKQINFAAFWQQLAFKKTAEYVLLAIMSLALISQISVIWSKESYFNKKVVNNRFLEVNPYAEGVIKTLMDNKMTGAVFNSDSLGGQILWLGYPDLRPFRDGRNNSYERINNALITMSYPKENWPQIEKFYNFKIVILHPDNFIERSLLMYLKEQQPTWQLIAVDGTLVTYVKRGAFNLPKELDNFESSLKAHLYCTVDDVHTLRKLMEEKKKTAKMPFSLFPAADNVVYSEFFSLYMLGYQGAAVLDIIESLKVSNRPEIRNAADFILKQFANIP